MYVIRIYVFYVYIRILSFPSRCHPLFTIDDNVRLIFTNCDGTIQDYEFLLAAPTYLLFYKLRLR